MSDSSEDFEIYEKISYNTRLYCSLVSIIFIMLLFILELFSFIYNFFKSKSKTSSKNSLCYFSIGTLGKIMIFFSIFCIFLKSFMSYIFSYEEILNKEKCFYQGLITNISEISLICWNSNLNYVIYQFIFKNFHVKNNLIFYLMYGFLPSFLLSFFPIIIKNKYEIFGKSGAWCWLYFENNFKKNTFNSILSFIIFIFEWVNLIYSYYVVNKINKFLIHMIKQSENNSKMFKKFLSFLVSFPMILIFIWIFPSINRLYSFIKKKDNFTFLMGNGISMGLLGFFFSLNYFYFTYRKYFKCCFEKKKDEILNEETNDEIEM